MQIKNKTLREKWALKLSKLIKLNKHDAFSGSLD